VFFSFYGNFTLKSEKIKAKKKKKGKRVVSVLKNQRNGDIFFCDYYIIL